jgi:dTMP kinase
VTGPRKGAVPPPLDVVAELAAHQQNLSPPPAATRAALLALPLPAVCTVAAGDWFAARRRKTLAARAEELGSGDGPLPIEEAAEHESLPEQLARLWRDGVRALFVDGMRDQPGFARALRWRWPGALHPIPGPGSLDLLHGAEPIAWLGDGAARVAPGVAAPDGASLVLAALDDDGDPAATRAQGRHVWPLAIDPQRRLGPWSGVLPARAALGTDDGAALRARWQSHWADLGHPDLVRLAVLGLDPTLERALRGTPRPARSAAAAPAFAPRRARVIAITGLDGSGKSSHADRLARELQRRGASARVLKLYRQGAFLELANELGARTRRGAPLAAFRASRVVKLVDSLRVYRDHVLPALAECDALVMDRYVETHVAAAASQLGWDVSGHPALAPFPPPDVRFWLELDPDAALARRDARGEPPSADEHAVGMRGYAREFSRLAAASASASASAAGEVRLDATAPPDENARAIADRALPLVPSPRGPAAESRLVAPAAAPRAPAVARCILHLGGADGLPELGADIGSLRASLSSWCGDAAGAIPEAFWLEAYAAQLLLDLRTLAPSRARASLWPGALARMPGCADLVMLAEIERILLAELDIESCAIDSAAHAVAFARLGAASTAAPRLARDYASALEQLADESGWPSD